MRISPLDAGELKESNGRTDANNRAKAMQGIDPKRIDPKRIDVERIGGRERSTETTQRIDPYESTPRMERDPEGITQLNLKIDGNN